MQAISPQGVEDSGNYPESRCNENYPGKPIPPLGLMPGDYSGVTCKPRFHARRYATGGARSPSHLFVCAMCLRLPAAGLPKIKVGSLIGAIGYVRLGRERFNIPNEFLLALAKTIFGLASETELAQPPAGLSNGAAISELLLPELEKTKGQSLLGGMCEGKRPDDVRMLIRSDTQNAIK